MKVITLSKKFPAYHPRAGEPTGFEDAFLSGRKIHTIRANEKGYFKDGDIVSVRQWSGKPYASKQVVLRDGVRIGVVPVKLKFCCGEMFVKIGDRFQFVYRVASNDGLSVFEFWDWFNPKNTAELDLNYSLIHFTNYRY